MAQCDIKLELDAPFDADTRCYRLTAGAHLTGHAVVTVNEAVTCNGFDLELRCLREDHATGGKTDGGRELHRGLGPQRLFTGSWAPGSHRYPFDVRVPSPGHEGESARWIWILRAKADIPWATDAVDWEHLSISAETPDHASISYRPLPPTHSGGADPKQTLMKYGIGFITAPLLCAALGAVLASALQLSDDVAPYLFAGLALVGEALMVRAFFNARKRERNLLGPQLDISIQQPDHAYRSSGAQAGAPKLMGIATRRAPAVALIGGAHVELAVVERTNRVTSGTSSESRDRHLPLRRVLWSEELRLEYDPSDEYRFELPLPEAGSMPFSLGRDERGRGVFWELKVRITRLESEDEWAHCEIEVAPAAVAAG